MQKLKQYIGQNFNEVKSKLPNKGTKTELVLFTKKIKIGKIDDSPVYLECTIEEINLSTETIFNNNGKILSFGNTKETTNHKKVSKYKILSISGHNSQMVGQIHDSLQEVMTPKLRKIINIWKKWHLNDMQPNCMHQKSFNCSCDDFDEQAKIQTLKCPKKYEYGSKWLIKPLPETIVSEIQALFTNWRT